MAAKEDDIPPWKKHLIARLRVQNKCTSNGNSAVTVSTGRQLSPPYQNKLSGRAPNNQTSVGIRPCHQLSATCGAAESATNPSFSGRKDGNSVVSENKFVSPLSQRRKPPKMVQERAWTVDYTSCESVDTVSENDKYSRTSDSDSSEELHYGPGIVNKLKNKYLSLALRRENYTKQRPSIAQLRKATSLENMLDDDKSVKEVSEQHRVFRANGTENSTNRYRNSKRGTKDMKRARSMEAISRFENMISPPPCVDNARPKSLHEYILIGDVKEGNDKPYRKPKDKAADFENNKENGLFSNNYEPRLNRPKRIAPVMNEREKPPADVVKQAKMIFEKRPEQRTKPPVNTGEVAAKVACYKSIIVQSKPIKKPPVKTKPPSTFLSEKPVKNGNSKVKTLVEDKKSKPEVKKIETVRKFSASEVRIRGKPKKFIDNKNEVKVETTPRTSCKIEEIKLENEVKKEEIMEDTKPVVLKLPSPIPDVSIIEFPKSENDVTRRLCETPDLIMTASPVAVSTPSLDKHQAQNITYTIVPAEEPNEVDNSVNVTPNYSDPNRERSPASKTSSIENVPFNEPLKLIINGNQNRNSPSPEDSPRIDQISPIPPVVATRRKIISPPIRTVNPLNDRVVEKNLINAAKSLEQSNAVGCVTVEKTDVLVPKKVKRPAREPETNSIVFKFTDRKDVPDYVQNDRSRTAGRLEKPKVGEGGIILLPGASLDESFTDEDEEIMRYLQAPPSPCDVTFINDNILIDGKSSISQKAKKSRLRISFVDSGPDVYEYPSESSLLVDEAPSPISPTAATPLTAGHTVPMLSGSSLANYTPKSTEEFQPGVTRSVTNVPPLSPSQASEDLPEIDQPLLEEIARPVTFSAGTNSDMLF